MRVLGMSRCKGLALIVGLSVAMLATDVMSQSYGSWGSSGSYGSYGSSASYGSYGSSGSYGSYGSYGRVGIIGRIRARRAARWASHGSYGSYGSSGSSASYGSYGSYGSSGSYASVSYGETTAVAATTGNASIQVSLPEDAEVFVNDAPTTSTGAERSYVSRGLREGLTYSYAIHVEYEKNGKPVSEDKLVQLSAGQSVSLSFGRGEPSKEASTAPADEAVKTQVKVEVPADAKVFLSGAPTKQTGSTRTYSTMRLAAGQQWEDYTVRVEVERDGQTLVREEKLSVTGGGSYELAFDFDSTAPAQLAQLDK